MLERQMEEGMAGKEEDKPEKRKRKKRIACKEKEWKTLLQLFKKLSKRQVEEILLSKTIKLIKNSLYVNSFEKLLHKNDKETRFTIKILR